MANEKLWNHDVLLTVTLTNAQDNYVYTAVNMHCRVQSGVFLQIIALVDKFAKIIGNFTVLDLTQPKDSCPHQTQDVTQLRATCFSGG